MPNLPASLSLFLSAQEIVTSWDTQEKADTIEEASSSESGTMGGVAGNLGLCSQN